jgi:hypothetical protein
LRSFKGRAISKAAPSPFAFTAEVDDVIVRVMINQVY